MSAEVDLDIGAWLRALGLHQYESAFRANDIDADILPKLTAEDLTALGVTLVGHRRKLLDAIAARRRDSASPGEAPAATGRSKGDLASGSSDPERRQLTVMFCDLVGSTALASRLDPEDLREVIGAYHRCVAETATRFSGFVAKYMGDGVLVYFGYPHAQEDAAERAVQAGLALLPAVGKLKSVADVRLQARIGIATGPVVVGDVIGSGAAQEQAVVGETPNLAARLQGLAEPNTIVIGGATRRLIGGLFDCDDLGAVALKGYDRPIPAWRVVGTNRLPGRFEALRGKTLTPLIGRESELARLTACWEQALDGHGQLLLVSGESGIGKSRLLQALFDQVSATPHAQLRYFCSPHHQSSPLYPFIEQLEREAEFDSGDTAERKLEKIESLLAHGIVEIEAAAPLVAALLSVPAGSRHAPLAMSAQRQKELTYRLLIEHLAGIADRQPVLMVLEDAHWIDPSSAELLGLVVEHLGSWPVLLLVTFRPEFTPPWPTASGTVLHLGRLHHRQSIELVALLTGGKPLPSELLEQIVARTDGIPLFVEELTKTVIEAGDVKDEVPETLQASLLARLDRLGPAKPVIQVGAVIGREFDRALLASLIEIPRPELDRLVEHLLDSELVYRQGRQPHETYVFKHALIQQTAYESLLKSRRRTLHGDIAQALLIQAPDRTRLLAHHWERAEDLGRALEYRIKAAEQSSALYAIREANAEYWSALALLDRMPPSQEVDRRRIDIMIRMTDWGSYFSSREAERARPHLERAIEAAQSLQDWAASARLRAYIGQQWEDEALLLAAADDATRSDDVVTEAAVAVRCSAYFGEHGLFGRALGYVEHASRLFDGLDEKLEQGQLLASSGRCYNARAGRLDEAFHCARQAKQIASILNDPRLNAWMPMEAEVFFYKGLWKEVVEVVETGTGPAWTVGKWDVLLWTHGWGTIACLKLGHIAEAARMINRAASEILPKVGYDFPKIYPLIALAQVQLAQKNTHAAVDTARQALTLAERSVNPLEEGAAHRALAQAHELAGHDPDASAHYRNSIAVLDAIDSPPELAQSLLAYGSFLSRSDRDDAGKHLQRALTLFEGLGATGWIAEARSALAFI
jgi:class 3 adenylate cyclase/tetratricopeptide (TPR) repeat protein